MHLSSRLLLLNYAASSLALFINISPPHDHSRIQRRQAVASPDGTCGLEIAGVGPGEGYTCTGSLAGPCCSKNGYCGATDGHCGADCQEEFGTCGDNTWNPPDPDSNMLCGIQNGNKSCPAGNCCSQYGFCGTSADHCAIETCQSDFGDCGGNNGGGGDGRRCGPAFGNEKCTGNKCCSPDGWCGIGADYCTSPECLLGFGKCDSDYTPTGRNTSTVARPKIGDVDYASIIKRCYVAGAVALTFDDGPYLYTNDLLDLLAAYNVKATFFITGINKHKGSIDDENTPYPAILRRMVAEGHQIASHTWSHRDLSAISEFERRDELYKLEMAIRNVIGKFPTYIRPPFSSCDSTCERTLDALGYHQILFDLDTEDYLNPTPDLLWKPQQIIDSALTSHNPNWSNYLSIMHDIHYQTVYSLTEYFLNRIVQHGYRAMTVGECLLDPEENWYRDSSP